MLPRIHISAIRANGDTMNMITPIINCRFSLRMIFCHSCSFVLKYGSIGCSGLTTASTARPVLNCDLAAIVCFFLSDIVNHESIDDDKNVKFLIIPSTSFVLNSIAIIVSSNFVSCSYSNVERLALSMLSWSITGLAVLLSLDHVMRFLTSSACLPYNLLPSAFPVFLPNSFVALSQNLPIVKHFCSPQPQKRIFYTRKGARLLAHIIDWLWTSPCRIQENSSRLWSYLMLKAPYTKPKENVFIIPSTFVELSRFINEE